MKAPTAEVELANPLGDLIELTKPRITAMVVLTTLVGLVIASPSSVVGALAWVGVATVLGTAFLAASSSVLNMWLERELDRHMRRTESRPLAAQRVEPAKALVFGIALGILGTAILALGVNALTAFLGVLTLVLYLFVYTPLKRRTAWSTLVGAVPGAIPPMMGWTAVHNDLSAPAWMLFGILFLWQMPHFYAIAWLNREDYQRAGFRMVTAEDPEGRKTAWQMVLFTAFLVPVSLWPVLGRMAGGFYLAVALFLGGWFLMVAIGFARRRQRETARRVMLFSVIYLPLILFVWVADRLL